MNRRNFTLNLLDGGLYNAGLAFIAPSAVLPLFVSHYTQDPWIFGLITSLYMLGLTLPQPMGAAYLAQRAEVWSFLRFQLALPRIVLILMAISPWLPSPWALWTFFLTFALYSILTGLQTPMWYSFVSQVISKEYRGRFFGYRTTLGGALGVFATLLASRVLEALPHPWNFFFCFSMAALLVTVSYFCMMATRHDWQPVSPRKLSLGGVWGSPLFRRYLLGRILMSSNYMAIAFYVVVGMQRFSLSLGDSSLLGLAIVSLPNLLGALWGSLVDRWGCRPVQLGLAFAAALAHLALAFADAIPLYVLALIVAGCASKTMTMLDGKWLLDLGHDRCEEYIGLFNFLKAPFAIGLPLVGGWFATQYGMSAVFALVAFGWLLGGIVFAFGLEESRRTYAQSLG